MNWDAFGPMIQPYATTCSSPLMEQHARLAAIDFLGYTKAWIVELAPLTADGVLTAFTMVTPADSKVEKLRAVNVTDTYGNVSHAGVKTPEDGARLVRDGSAELIAYTANRTTLNVRPVQSAGSTIVATVSLKPTLAATTIDDGLFEQFGMVIAKGAIASLTAMANRPWTDITTARIAAAEFMNAKAVTARKVERGFSTSGRRSATRWF